MSPFPCKAMTISHGNGQNIHWNFLICETWGFLGGDRGIIGQCCDTEPSYVMRRLWDDVFIMSIVIPIRKLLKLYSPKEIIQWVQRIKNSHQTTSSGNSTFKECDHKKLWEVNLKHAKFLFNMTFYVSWELFYYSALPCIFSHEGPLSSRCLYRYHADMLFQIAISVKMADNRCYKLQADVRW